MQDMIHLRPHHLLCLQAFRGKGYSESFVEKMTAVHAMLRENPKLEIRLAEGADDLCAACPNLEDGVCTSKKPPVFDRNVLKELENRGIRESVLSGLPEELGLTEELVRGCCPDCQWQEICLAVCREKDGQRE